MILRIALRVMDREEGTKRLSKLIPDLHYVVRRHVICRQDTPWYMFDWEREVPELQVIIDKILTKKQKKKHRMKSKEQKKKEAQERKTAHGLRTTNQQLKLLESRPGFARKERAKLAQKQKEGKK